VDVVMDVDATKNPDKPSLSICPKTKQWIHPPTIPLNSNNLRQTRMLLLSTTNQIHSMMDGDDTEIPPTRMMAGVARPHPAKPTCLH
jgi:hypothetical protein